MEEAGGLPEEQTEFQEEGIPFAFVLAIYRNESDQVPNAKMGEKYAEKAGLATEFPVTSDTEDVVTSSIPWEGTIPGKCAISTELEILDCWSNHKNDRGFNAIRDHWAASQ